MDTAIFEALVLRCGNCLPRQNPFVVCQCKLTNVRDGFTAVLHGLLLHVFLFLHTEKANEIYYIM